MFIENSDKTSVKHAKQETFHNLLIKMFISYIFRERIKLCDHRLIKKDRKFGSDIGHLSSNFFKRKVFRRWSE